ncbi:hypothetical protein BEL01nite_85930 [Bradyrhizobium elkanii]|nr:hypothetical protein BEL01nite_85930 [Bradyrhizobium elkanii]
MQSPRHYKWWMKTSDDLDLRQIRRQGPTVAAALDSAHSKPNGSNRIADS